MRAARKVILRHGHFYGHITQLFNGQRDSRTTWSLACGFLCDSGF